MERMGEGLRSPVQRLNDRFDALERIRQPHEPTWRSIARLCAPKHGRYVYSDRDKSGNDHAGVINEAGIMARRKLGAGLLDGLTSPSRPWAELTFEDADLASYQPHKEWLSIVGNRMFDIFRESNLYSALSRVYAEQPSFGTGGALVDLNFARTIHLFTPTIGQYAIATNEDNVVDTFTLELEMSVEQIVSKFVQKNGWEVVSMPIRNAYDRGDYDQSFPVRRMIRPRKQRDPNGMGGERHPIQSVWWLPDQCGHDHKPLDDNGYEESPILCPRWDVIGNDTWGVGCGEDALGPMRSLQHMEKTYGVSLEMSARPMLRMPTSLRKNSGGVRPGGIVYSDDPNAVIAPAFQVQPDLQGYNLERAEMARRVDVAFYGDVMSAITNIRQQRGGDPTATEIAEVAGERLVQLAPVLERMQVELIEPLIDRTFAIMQRAGLIPPPPEDIAGETIRVNHISPLAQAQRQVTTRSTERAFQFTLGVAQAKPNALDMIDEDELIADYWNTMGANPKALKDKRKVEQERQARAEQQQEALAAEQAQQVADVAKTAGDIETQGGESNVVADLLGQLPESGEP